MSVERLRVKGLSLFWVPGVGLLASRALGFAGFWKVFSQP